MSKVSVRDSDIRNGKRRNNNQCMIVLALMREYTLEKYEWRVESDSIIIYNGYASSQRTVRRIPLPKNIVGIIRKWDGWYGECSDPSPFEFEIDIPEKYLKKSKETP